MIQKVAAIGTSLGEAILFDVVAVVMVTLTVFGLLVARHAVYSAVYVIADVVCLTVLYTALGVPFMGVVRIAVYAGAILMMFLFVFTMIGVDATDSTYETLRDQRAMAVLGVFGFAAIAGGAVMDAQTPDPVGLAKADEEANPTAIAESIFTSHTLTVELTGALLIAAAVGAMTLTHRQGMREHLNQAELADAKMATYAQTGRHIGQKPPTGIYAESNSAAAPVLTNGGEIVAESVPHILRIRGQTYTPSDTSPITAARGAHGKLDGRGRKVPHAHMPGMPGGGAPSYRDSREEAPAYGGPREEPSTGGSPGHPCLDGREESH